MKTSCLDYALNYIYRFPKTEKELISQLFKKGYLQEQVDETMAYLKDKWFIDDAKFADSYIYSQSVKKWKPLFQVKIKLYQKGVDKTLVEKVAKEYESDISKWTSQKIIKEIEKYKKKGLNGFDIIQKLLLRGYSLDDIKKVL